MIKLPKINAAKAAKASLPYVVMGVLATKLGEAYRLTSGGDVLDKVHGYIPAFLLHADARNRSNKRSVAFFSHAPSPHI